MTLLSPSINKRKAYFLAILFIAGSVFTADILDLREELRFLSYPYPCLDNNVATGITATTADLETEPLLVLRSINRLSSVKISFLHLLPYGFRAPPASL